jgi:hypothetical protein
MYLFKRKVVLISELLFPLKYTPVHFIGFVNKMKSHPQSNDPFSWLQLAVAMVLFISATERL